MKKIGLYLFNGKIDTVVTCSDFMATLQGGEGLECIELDSTQEADNSYVDIATQVVMAKQSMVLITTNTSLTADGTDEAIISDIPAGVQVEWPDGQTDIVTGGEISFSVDLPGTYTFKFTAVPHLDKEITVEAIAAT